MRGNTKKKIAPVVVTILALLLVVPQVGTMLAVMAGLAEAGINELLPFLLLFAIAGGAVAVGMLTAMAQRLREIDGGEEEDAKKY